MDYIWRKLRSESVMRTPYYGVSLDRLRHPHGHEVDYYVIEHPRQAAGVVALDDARRVLMVQQWRHPVQKLLWSLPAGGMDAGETPEAAAHRELREETGHAAETLELLYSYHPNPATTNQMFHLFLANGVKQVTERLPGEIHDIQWFERAEIEAMLARNELLDGLTLVGIFAWLRRNIP
jgi:8-oxo-dGTP pyrophosphatase MutT (NUDIX family)